MKTWHKVAIGVASLAIGAAVSYYAYRKVSSKLKRYDPEKPHFEPVDYGKSSILRTMDEVLIRSLEKLDELSRIAGRINKEDLWRSKGGARFG